MGGIIGYADGSYNITYSYNTGFLSGSRATWQFAGVGGSCGAGCYKNVNIGSGTYKTDQEFIDYSFRLSSGDALYIYTDGVPEAHSSDDTMFGEERLEKVLSSFSKTAAPQEIMMKVSDEVDKFANGAPQYDDITMLCLIMN